ncbi:hypothetical protein SARC_03073, partial [Sphaeroforma arctica JP610]
PSGHNTSFNTNTNKVPTELNADQNKINDKKLRRMEEKMQRLEDDSSRLKKELIMVAENVNGMQPTRRVDTQRYRMKLVIPNVSESNRRALEDGKLFSLTQTKSVAREGLDATRTDYIQLTLQGVRVERQKETFTSHIDIKHMALLTVATTLIYTQNILSDPSAILDMIHWVITVCEQCKLYSAPRIARIDERHLRSIPVYDSKTVLSVIHPTTIQINTASPTDRISDPLFAEYFQLHSFCICECKRQKQGEICFAFNNNKREEPCPDGHRHERPDKTQSARK